MSGPGVYAYRFRNGEPAPFPRAVAERIFNKGAIDSDVSSEIIRWADGEAEIDIGLGEETDGLACEEFTSLAFVDRLYELAAEVGLVVIWDGRGSMFAVTDADLIRHLPPEFADDEPVVVHSLQEFIDWMGVIFVNPRDWDRVT